jgi:colanic acid biosynthesis protein WcaH
MLFVALITIERARLKTRIGAMSSPPSSPPHPPSGPQLLNEQELTTVIRLTPLVSIDLIVRDSAGRVLLGLRNNEPAKDFYFVPGGRILKDERLCDAFARILINETNIETRYESATLLGVYEHFYSTNRFGEPNLGTHYVVLAFEVAPPDVSVVQTEGQHSEYRWMHKHELLASALVHDNTKAYFRVAGVAHAVDAAPLLT